MAGNMLALTWDLIARDGASPAFTKVSAAADKAAASTEAAAVKAEESSTRIGSSMSTMAKVGVAGGLAFAAAAVKMASEFQRQMLLVQTQAGASAQEVKNMTPAILSLSGKVAQAPEALATSLYHVESTGLRGAKALDAVKVAAEGARVGHADLEETTNALTATIASGMVPATESFSQAMGQLNTIVGSGDMKLSDLNDALGTGVLVQVKQYGATINDVGAALADFGDNNIRGADAATMLRMAVQAIAKPGVGAADALRRVGLTVGQLQSDEQTGGLNKALTDLHGHLVSSGIDASQWGALMTDAFTKKAGGGIITLIGTYDRFEQKYKEVQAGANSFAQSWAATQKTAAFQAAALKDNIDAMTISVGSKLLPVVTATMGYINRDGVPALQHLGSGAEDVAHWFGDLPAPIRDTGVMLAALGLANAIGLTGRLSTAVQGMGAAFSATGGSVRAFRDDIAVQQALSSMDTGLSDAERALGGLGSGASAAGTELSSVQRMMLGYDAALAESVVADDAAAAGAARFSTALSTVAIRGGEAAASGIGSVVSALGGPWGIAIGAAILALPSLASGFELLAGHAIDAAGATQNFTSALQASNGAIDASVKKNIEQQLSQDGVISTFQRAGISAQDAIAGIEGNAAAQHRVTQELQDYITTSIRTEGRNNANAQSAAKARDTYAQLEQAFGTSASAADYFSGKADQATAATGHAKVATDTLHDSLIQMGITSGVTWSNNTATVQHATQQQIQALGQLGFSVTHLPQGKITVTADATPAVNTLNQVEAQWNGRTISFNVNAGPLGGTGGPVAHLQGGKAAGGPIYGPGSGTSDTAGLYALSNNEHVWTAAEVSAAGGHAAVQSLRSAVLAAGRGYANGGPITFNAAISPASVAKFNSDVSAFGQSAASQFFSFTDGGGGAGSPAMRALGQQIAASMGFGGQFAAIDYIFSHESGWNPNAQNPTSTAYGIPQFLNSTWGAYGGKTSNPSAQIRDGIEYMVNRYGSPNGAAAFWQAHHWYDQGGWLPPGATMALNGTGKPERIRTAEQESALQSQLSGRPVRITGTVAFDPSGLITFTDARIDRSVGALADTIHYTGA